MSVYRVRERRKRHLRLIGILTVLAVATGVLVYGGYGFFRRYQATHDTHPTIAHTVITNSSDYPDETPPTDTCRVYKVAVQNPERINIPSIGANGCIEQVGIDQHGNIAVPNSIYTAAWYVKSALPGQSGLSVIVGHISGRYKTDGIFEHLDKLKSGDEFTLELGSGKVLMYRVFKNQSVLLDQAVRTLLAKEPAVTSQLNLITCAGRYDRSTKLYDHRVIVSAKLISS